MKKTINHENCLLEEISHDPKLDKQLTTLTLIRDYSSMSSLRCTSDGNHFLLKSDEDRFQCDISFMRNLPLEEKGDLNH